MKKLLTLCVAIAASLLTTTQVNAQVKIGFFDDQQILPIMPGYGKADTLLQKYATDSLAAERDIYMDQLKSTDSLLKDSSKLSKSMKEILQKQAAEAYFKLQNWQQYQEQMLQQKQEQLLAPLRKPIYEALKEVIAEQKFTAIFKPSAAYWAEKSDEVALRVLAKLRIPLPKEIEDQIISLGYRKGATLPSPTPQNNKPATAPKPKAKG